MLLVKLNDKLMFNGDKNKSHWYLVYRNKNKVKYLRQMTHLYKPDKKRFYQLKNGQLEKYFVSSFDTVQGVKKEKINKFRNRYIKDLKKENKNFKYCKVYKRRK